MGMISFLKATMNIIEEISKKEKMFSSILSLINSLKTTLSQDIKPIEKLIIEEGKTISYILCNIEKIKISVEKIEILFYIVAAINIVMLILLITVVLR
ncbi:MAG: hypothetical protein ACP5IO_00285 [Elusimicrobiales bacterium]